MASEFIPAVKQFSDASIYLLAAAQMQLDNARQGR
jgi:hypothetical protein